MPLSTQWYYHTLDFSVAAAHAISRREIEPHLLLAVLIMTPNQNLVVEAVNTGITGSAVDSHRPHHSNGNESTTTSAISVTGNNMSSIVAHPSHQR